MMKKFIGVILSIVFLSGCATYKFHHGKAPYDKGYVVSRDDYTIPEYTLGPENTVPDRKLAKERFNRRKDVVEDYYKRMGYIENHFNSSFLDYWVMIGKLLFGIVRLPAIAVDDYRYEHDPEYRERAKKLEAEKEAEEQARIIGLKEKLGVYVQKDLKKEASVSGKPLPAQAAITKAKTPKKVTQARQKVKEVTPRAKKNDVPKETASIVSVEVEQKTVQEPPAKIKEVSVEEKVMFEQEQKAKTVSLKSTQETSGIKQGVSPATQKTSLWKKIFSPREKRASAPGEKKAAVTKGDLTAVITANPAQGYSPLRVQFSGSRSHSKVGRIISYDWDFGDGDTSNNKKNPVNTYLSTTYGKVAFTVTLTVKDNKGNIASSSTLIEVMTK